MVIAGYVRPHPKCGSTSEQRKMISHCYWTHFRDDGQWYGIVTENVLPPGKAFNSIVRREELQRLLLKLGKGDWLLVPWFGVLCQDLEDGLEGLPAILGLGIRVLLVGDCFELKEEHIKFMRVILRDVYRTGTKYAPIPLGAVKKNNDCPERSVAELKFMQYCYRERIGKNQSLTRVKKFVDRKWAVHPRTKSPITTRSIQRAVEAYRDILSAVRLGQKMPRWVNRATKEGFFTDPLEDLIALRQARLDDLVKSLKK